MDWRCRWRAGLSACSEDNLLHLSEILPKIGVGRSRKFSVFYPICLRERGTTCGTTCGTSNNNDIRIKEITSTHTSNILSRYKTACASADTREDARALCCELIESGWFQTHEYTEQTDAFKLLTHIWIYYPEMQIHMDSPMIASEAVQFVSRFGFSVDTQNDVARVLQAMNNTKGLSKRNRSVYHTLRKWLQQDNIRKKRIEDEKSKIYQPRR